MIFYAFINSERLAFINSNTTQIIVKQNKLCYITNDDNDNNLHIHDLNTFDNMFIYIKGQYEGFNIPYTVDIKDNTYVLKSNFSSDILTDEAIQDLLGENNISSYKSKLEESGFKCK